MSNNCAALHEEEVERLGSVQRVIKSFEKGCKQIAIKIRERAIKEVNVTNSILCLHCVISMNTYSGIAVHTPPPPLLHTPTKTLPSLTHFFNQTDALTVISTKNTTWPDSIYFVTSECQFLSRLQRPTAGFVALFFEFDWVSLYVSTSIPRLKAW